MLRCLNPLELAGSPWSPLEREMDVAPQLPYSIRHEMYPRMDVAGRRGCGASCSWSAVCRGDPMSMGSGQVSPRLIWLLTNGYITFEFVDVFFSHLSCCAAHKLV